MEEKELTPEEMLEIVQKYRHAEGKRLSKMTKEERMADYKKMQEKALKSAKEIGIEIVKPKRK